MMQQTARSGEKAPLFGGRKPLFTQSQLLKLTWPLLVEQFLAVTVGMADTGRFEVLGPLRELAFDAQGNLTSRIGLPRTS